MKTNTHNGLIGFFDILGYQNLLEKNSPEDIAQSVLEFLTNINSIVTTEIKEQLDKHKVAVPVKDNIKEMVDSFKWMIFSDTILLTLPLDNQKDNWGSYWIIFMVICRNLQIKMFEEGLPVRGIINYGDFYLHESCFAGRSIIDAYNLCNQLEIAACVFAPDAQRKLEDNLELIFPPEGIVSLEGRACYYLIPTKKGEFHYLVLKALVYNDDGNSIREQVLSSFWGHNKDIPLSVQKKISNTEQWLNFLKIKNDHRSTEES